MKNTKKTQKKLVDKGRLYLLATFNNTIITITDINGQPIIVGSTGMYGFSGTRKSTPYAAMVTVETTIKKAIEQFGLKEVDVFVKGIGPGREAGMRIIRNSNLEVGRIIDITPVPHNGVRPPKIRRV
jgi:small subunit ribosomal protein S11